MIKSQRLLASGLIMFAPLAACGQSSERSSIDNGTIDYANTVNSSDNAIIPQSQLVEHVKRFEAGEIELAYPLMSTFQEMGNEVAASTYARSLSVQENDPQMLAEQVKRLNTLPKSPSVCEAMKLNLEVWNKWNFNPHFSYDQAKEQYGKKCL
jgi:hypothetical protein